MDDPSVPAFTTDVEPTDDGADGASEQLAAFATNHRVPEPIRSRLARVAAEVLRRLAAVGGMSTELTLVEADIDQGTIQALFTRDLGSRESVTQTRMLLARTAEACDGFAIYCPEQRSTIEVWVCFALP